jgi:acylphosphatase
MADVFQTGNGSPANFSDGTVEVVVNGSSKGRKATTNGETLGAFLNRQAQAYGIRTFTAYADGHKLETSGVNVPAASKQSIEITAKDARGLRKSSLKHIFCAA